LSPFVLNTQLILHLQLLITSLVSSNFFLSQLVLSVPLRWYCRYSIYFSFDLTVWYFQYQQTDHDLAEWYFQYQQTDHDLTWVIFSVSADWPCSRAQIGNKDIVLYCIVQIIMYVETFKTNVIGFIVKCHVLDVILTDNLHY
jgi:hypothetical protein